MSDCPYCEYTTPEPDDGDPRVKAHQEIEHMQDKHPDVIAARLEALNIHPAEFTAQIPNLSSELDEIPTARIMDTVKAIKGANEMADALLAKNAKTKAYVAGHDEVADALVAYCERRVSLGRP